MNPPDEIKIPLTMMTPGLMREYVQANERRLRVLEADVAVAKSERDVALKSLAEEQAMLEAVRKDKAALLERIQKLEKDADMVESAFRSIFADVREALNGVVAQPSTPAGRLLHYADVAERAAVLGRTLEVVLRQIQPDLF